ncbi:MAG TPA: SH3 domain-containing protein, partial [Flavobacteriaceae bacterium]|nr:SH3 domain-containing protein [Flavobacteriaceae bacterium]
LFIALMAFSFAYITHSSALQKNEGIIFSERVPVKNEPTNRSDAAFYLHEGSKVRIIDEDGDWYRIELVDGNDGWLLKSDLKAL